MKIKSFILGSVAAVGFSTGAMAADLGTVLTSLDVCDSLGISGLTLSSDTNCLQITGGVAYSFKWGDYKGTLQQNTRQRNTPGDTITIPDDDFFGLTTQNLDWDSEVDAWLKFVGTASSSFGPASATIKLDFDENRSIRNEGFGPGQTMTSVLRVEEAYVSVGDTTVLMAGRKGSIANFDDDKPLNWLGMFMSDGVDAGVLFRTTGPQNMPTGGHVIQVTSDLGNGVFVGAALENLNGTGVNAGTAVGVISYAGNGITAHATVLAGGILDGTIENWGIHAGMTGEFDMFKFVGAFAADDSGYWNVLGSVSGTFDMFTLAVSGEAGRNTATTMEAGFGVSASAEVTTGVTINAGFKWFDTNTSTANNENWQAAVQLVAAVTETVTITGEIGVYGENTAPATNTVYGSAKLGWAPGGGFTSSIEGKAYATGAYSVEFKAAKDFE